MSTTAKQNKRKQTTTKNTQTWVIYTYILPRLTELFWFAEFHSMTKTQYLRKQENCINMNKITLVSYWERRVGFSCNSSCCHWWIIVILVYISKLYFSKYSHIIESHTCDRGLWNRRWGNANKLQLWGEVPWPNLRICQVHLWSQIHASVLGPLFFPFYQLLHLIFTSVWRTMTLSPFHG